MRRPSGVVDCDMADLCSEGDLYPGTFFEHFQIGAIIVGTFNRDINI